MEPTKSSDDASQPDDGADRKSLVVTFGEALLTYTPFSLASSPGAPNAHLAANVEIMLQAVGGSELNMAVAYCAIGGEASWVSILPTGPLAEIILQAGTKHGVKMQVIRRPDSTVGTLHVMDPDGNGLRPIYQRTTSAFSQTTKALGRNSFGWSSHLHGAKWLLLTGITPVLGEGPLAAWTAALECASAPASTTNSLLDLRHHPSLAPLDDLWDKVAKVVPRLSMLILCEDSLRALAERLLDLRWGWPAGAHQAPGAEAGASDNLSESVLHEAQRTALVSLRERLGVPLLGCCFKRPLLSKERGRGSSSGRSRKSHLGGGVRRWSMVAFDGGEASTLDTPVMHSPVHESGGSDAWAAGFVDAAVKRKLHVPPPARQNHAGKEKPSADEMISWRDEDVRVEKMTKTLRIACRRGDLLAALQMATYGDQSEVTGPELAAAEKKWKGMAADLTSHASTTTPAPTPPSTPSFSTPASTPARMPALTIEPGDVDVLERLGEAKIVPVVSLSDAEHAVPTARALLQGGLRVMELELQSAAAEEGLRRIAGEVPDMWVGAGPVVSVQQAEQCVEDGARFLVSPGFSPKVVQWACEHSIPIIPGVATATEVEAAMEHGLSCLRFFPAQAMGGAELLAALSAPYKGVRWMPAGGVSARNLGEYLAIPSVLACGGSWLTPADALKRKAFEEVTAHARAAIKAANAELAVSRNRFRYEDFPLNSPHQMKHLNF